MGSNPTFGTIAIGRHLADPAVRYADPDYLLTALDTSNRQLNLDGSLRGIEGSATTHASRDRSDAARAWAAGLTGSAEIAIGVIDEGIAIDHPDLAANIRTNPGEIAGNGIDGDASVRDGGARSQLDGHGTQVAGRIGAVGGTGLGVAGASWHVRLIAGKFLGRRGGFVADAAAALDDMTALKTRAVDPVNVVAMNDSWGGGRRDDRPCGRRRDRLVVRDPLTREPRRPLDRAIAAVGVPGGPGRVSRRARARRSPRAAGGSRRGARHRTRPRRGAPSAAPTSRHPAARG